MSQKVPTRDFQWVNQDVVNNMSTMDVMKIDSESNTGYVFEVDAEIPQNIHDR